MRSQMQSAANISRLHGVSEKVASPKKWAGVYEPWCLTSATQLYRHTFQLRPAGTRYTMCCFRLASLIPTATLDRLVPTPADLIDIDKAIHASYFQSSHIDLLTVEHLLLTDLYLLHHTSTHFSQACLCHDEQLMLET